MSWSRREGRIEGFIESVRYDCKIYPGAVQCILESISNIEDMIISIPFNKNWKFKKKFNTSCKEIADALSEMIYYEVNESFENDKILTINSIADIPKYYNVPEIYQPLIECKEAQFLELVNDKIKDVYNTWEKTAYDLF